MLITTDHPEFKSVNLNAIGALMKHKIIVDGRRTIEPYSALVRR